MHWPALTRSPNSGIANLLATIRWRREALARTLCSPEGRQAMSAGTPSGKPGSYKYLPDLPAEDDQFGGHDRISRGMADAVLSNPTLKVVGLIGPWGSGKSTVVRFFERHLGASNTVKSYVFTYDAWLHQNDPPKRAFLEGFIHFLIEKDLA